VFFAVKISASKLAQSSRLAHGRFATNAKVLNTKDTDLHGLTLLIKQIKRLKAGCRPKTSDLRLAEGDKMLPKGKK
jgi:hypothetical protein